MQTITVFCQIEVGRKGRVRNRRFTCRNGKGFHASHVRTALEAIEKARFVPAKVDNKAVPVNFNFRIIFDYQDACRVFGIPNFGLQTDRLGPNYYMPQERVDTHDWFSRAPRVRSGNLFTPKSPPDFHISVAVDIEGTASQARLEHGRFRSDAQAREALQAIEASRFIPGLVNGVPQAMRYHEIYHTFRHVAKPGKRALPAHGNAP